MRQFFAEPIIIKNHSSDIDLSKIPKPEEGPGKVTVSKLFKRGIIGSYADSLSASLMKDGDKDEHIVLSNESFTLENEMTSFKITFAFSDIDDVTALDCLWLIRALSFCMNPERIAIFIKSNEKSPAKKAGSAFLEIAKKAFLPITYANERAFLRRYCEY